MINKIERIRKSMRVKKSDLCKSAGISTAMYSRYLSGTGLGVDICKKMLDYLGYELKITIKDEG